MKTRNTLMHIFTVVMAISLLLNGILVMTAPRSVYASDTPDPSSVTIAGSLQSPLGCPGDWQPECTATRLTYEATDRVWQGTWNVPAGDWEYKAALNGTWDENYGANAQRNGPNIPLNLASATSVKFYYDHETHWITSNKNARIATAPGSYQSEIGCPGDWQPDCLRSWLQDPDGNGTYTFSTTAIPPGSYEFKITINESWDENYGSGGVQGGSNIPFTVPGPGYIVTFSFESATNMPGVSLQSTLPKPDDNVEWDGLRHDSRDPLYRTPGGAVPADTPVTLRFRTYHNDVTSVKARVYDLNSAGQTIYTMMPVATDVSCYQDLPFTCDFWAVTLPNAAPNNLWYRFIVTDGGDTDYYADNTPALDGGLGRVTDDVVDHSYALTIYDPAFDAPSWASNAVIYQIFPDRFRNGRMSNDPKTGDVRYDDPVIKLPWGTLPEGYCRNYADGATNCPWRFDDTPPPSSPDKEQPRGRDYLGGDLKGVDQQLDYLKALGVTAIYFNPIFDAGSNHSYDTQDYYKIDPYFGTQKDWENLVKHARQRGIRIILDGVFNHLSSDSPFFDRYHHYDTVGACESADSPYRDWFSFRAPAGNEPAPCAPSTPGGSDTYYDGWFGFDSIPVINKTLPEVQAYFLTGENSVSRYWLNQGASAWRMDVMGDSSFPDGYWQTFRGVVKDAKPDALIISETWQKDSTLLRMLRGDRADTTMNYRLRDAVIGLLTPGPFDSKGFADSGRIIAPSEFAARLESIREDYPDAAYYSLMNLLDSHDTERLLWALTPGTETTAGKELNAANVAEGKRRLQIASLIQFSLPGAPTVFYGDEVGLTGDDDPDDRRTYPWADLGGSPDNNLLGHYQTLAALRRQNPALTGGDFHVLLADDASEVVAYGRKTGSQAAIVIVNRSNQERMGTIPVAGYLPDGVALQAAYVVGSGGPSSLTVANGRLVGTIGPKSALLLLTGLIDLQPPDAPTGLVATAGNGQVGLSWSAVNDAASYRLYRSPVTGGGYTLVTSLNATDYTDTTVVNGKRYYYVVRAVDAAGNEGSVSNEAGATPFFPIGYAVLQWPKTINHVLGVQPTETIYGQVYVAGYTDASPKGDPAGILAQVGFGPLGSDPATWTSWKAMSFNAGCACGNNYEYMGNLRPEQTGSFDLLVRFSTDDGLNWVYGDQDGFSPGDPGTDMPGVLTVVANPDTTPPAKPTGLRATDWSANFISLQWDAVGDAAEYWIYRHEPGGAFGAPIAKIPASATIFTDNDVVSGITYTYAVQAADAALNLSQFSSEVSQRAELKLVNVTFRVHVPPETPPDDIVYIPGNIDLLGPWNPGKQPMTDMGGGIWEVTLQILDGTALEYKYTRGTWDQVEWWGSITGVTNRHVTINYGTTGNQLVDNTATDWGNGPDETKAVQYWRDPLVSATTPADGATVPAPSNITITFSRAIQPSGAGFSSSVVVKLGTNTITGVVTPSGSNTLVWTPSVPLNAGTYAVTVFNVRSDLAGDSVSMQKPYVFSFTVGP